MRREGLKRQLEKDIGSSARGWKVQCRQRQRATTMKTPPLVNSIDALEPPRPCPCLALPVMHPLTFNKAMLQPSFILTSGARASNHASTHTITISSLSLQPRRVGRCQSNHPKALMETRSLRPPRACKLQPLSRASTGEGS